MLKLSLPFRRHNPPVSDAAGLAAFTGSRAAFVAQKSTIEYCRARAGLNSDKLFKEAAFVAALEVCRWESFAAVLGDATLVIEGMLRPYATDREVALVDRLAAIHRAILLAEEHRPAHRAEGWGDVLAAFPPRLAAAQLAAPLAPDRIAATGAERIFEVLPIHPSLRGHDREMVINNVRFWMVTVKEELGRRADLPAIAADLLRES